MTWTEQANSMTKIWMDAQKNFWGTWYDAIQSSGSTPMSMPMLNMPMMGGIPGMNTELLEQWRRLAAQGMDMWMTGAEPASRDMSKQLLASQTAMMRMFEMTSEAWRSMAPRLDAGENWQDVINGYMEQWRAQMMTPINAVKAAEESAELWGLYIEQLQMLGRPFLESSREASGYFNDAFTKGSNADLVGVNSLFKHAYEETFGRLINAPSFGFTRELDKKLIRGYGSWMDLRRAMADYQIVLSDGWGRVFERLLTNMVKRGQEDKPIESTKDLLSMWTRAADNGFEEVFRSAAYQEAQSNLVAATMRYRLEEQEITETFLQTSYVPTRSEMDEAHRNIYELRKEVKALKRQLRETPSANGRRRKKAAEQQHEHHEHHEHHEG